MRKAYSSITVIHIFQLIFRQLESQIERKQRPLFLSLSLEIAPFRSIHLPDTRNTSTREIWHNHKMTRGSGHLMGSVEESGVRPMENTLARIQRNSAISVQTDLLFRCRAGNRLDDGHPGCVEAALSFIPEGGPIEFYPPALCVTCVYRKIQLGDM